VPELLEAADRARARGATVVAITASQSPLARKADLALIVDHVEDVATQLPMVSRILHLLVIDILAVGVAMRRSGVPLAEVSGFGAAGDVVDADEAGSGAAAALSGAVGADAALPPARRRAGSTPGVSASTPLARLTSHSS
jgi:glucokinase